LSKKVLILSTKNNSRSIIAEAVLHKYMKQIDTFSAGLSPDANTDSNAMKILQREGLWDAKFHPQNFNDFNEVIFDLVIVLCEKALDKIPSFPNDTKVIYLEYENLQGQNFSVYEQTLKDMKMEIIPIIRLEL